MRDIRKIENRFDLRRLNEWQSKGYIKILRKGYYIFTDIDLNDEMSEEEIRAFREGLDEESLAVFDLLKKPDLSAGEIKKVKAVAVDLLKTLKEEKLCITRWQDKEATRDAVHQAILDFLWNDSTGLPVDKYTESDVQVKADDVYRHVYRVYPTLPSPFYQNYAAA